MQGDLSEVGGRIAPARALPWRGLASRIVAVGASPHAGWLAPGALLLAWQAASSAGMISDAVLPSPAAVAAAGWSLTLSGELPHHMGVSFLRAMAGLAVGGGIGFALGLACRAMVVTLRLRGSAA